MNDFFAFFMPVFVATLLSVMVTALVTEAVVSNRWQQDVVAHKAGSFEARDNRVVFEWNKP